MANALPGEKKVKSWSKSMRFCMFTKKYYPDRGASETYVGSLSQELMALGHEVYIITLEGTNQQARYSWKNLNVFNISNKPQAYEEVISELQPNVVDIHWMPFENFNNVIREQQCKKIITIHHPSFICQRGDMVIKGRSFCNKEINPSTCTDCKAYTLGARYGLSKLIAAVPDLISARWPCSQSKVTTALKLKHEVSLAQNQIRTVLNEAEDIICLSQWTVNKLLYFKVEKEKIHLLRLGTHHDTRNESSSRPGNNPPKGIYVGRLDKEKGVWKLLEAVKAIRDRKPKIDIYGPLPKDNEKLTDELNKIFITSDGITYKGILEDGKVVSTMEKYDYALIPSQFPETGPYTVVEAMQAKIPVVGTDIPAINELIAHERNGLLVPFGSATKLASAIVRITTEKGLLEALKKNCAYPRTMKDVAQDYLRVARYTRSPSRLNQGQPLDRRT